MIPSLSHVRSLSLSSLLVDALLASSVIGLWPRFIEPELLLTSTIDYPMSSYYPLAGPALAGLRIVHLSDLHFHKGLSARILRRITKKVNTLHADLICFTGDFICYSQLEEPERLYDFLSSLKASIGAYCVLGNHDYSSYVSRNREGDYDVLQPVDPLSAMRFSLELICRPENRRIGKATAAAQAADHNATLIKLLKEASFTLLDNQTLVLPIGLNLVGLGDYSLGRFNPKEAFQGYRCDLPGIALSHNPDTFPYLKQYPADIILSGHTHGEQIHLPFCRSLSRKLARLENSIYSRGAYREGHQLLYVNRGLGSYKPFRLFAPPEIVLLRFQ